MFDRKYRVPGGRCQLRRRGRCRSDRLVRRTHADGRHALDLDVHQVEPQQLRRPRALRAATQRRGPRHRSRWRRSTSYSSGPDGRTWTTLGLMVRYGRGIRAICIITWDADGIRAWVTALKPDILGELRLRGLSPDLDAIVVEALKA